MVLGFVNGDINVMRMCFQCMSIEEKNRGKSQILFEENVTHY